MSDKRVFALELLFCILGYRAIENLYYVCIVGAKYLFVQQAINHWILVVGLAFLTILSGAGMLGIYTTYRQHPKVLGGAFVLFLIGSYVALLIANNWAGSWWAKVSENVSLLNRLSYSDTLHGYAEHYWMFLVFVVVGISYARN